MKSLSDDNDEANDEDEQEKYKHIMLIPQQTTSCISSNEFSF